MRRLLLFILVLLLAASQAYAACTTSFFTLQGSGQQARYYRCAAYAERPTTGLRAGDQLYAIDNTRFYLATNATTWLEIGSTMGSTGISGATINAPMYATGDNSGTSTVELADGQVLIGDTGAPPVPATISCSAGISCTPGAGTFAVAGIDAESDATTKGVATFAAADFNCAFGLCSLDYTNGQAASGSLKGYLTAADWTTFNTKAPANASYLTATSEAGLSAEVNLGALTTGLLHSTVSAGTATIAPYAGTTPCGAGDFITALSASGVATCGTAVGSGDVTSVGNCTSGSCLDGTAPGGTSIALYDGDSNKGTQVTSNLSADRTYTWPNESGTICTSTSVCSGYQGLITAGAGILRTGNTLTTASSEADFLTSGALTCGAGTQGKTLVHTTPLQYCDNAATPTLQYAAYGNSVGKATIAALADMVTTNANLTGPITSVGNATSIASQTGTGSTFVVQTSPNIKTSLILGDGEGTGTLTFASLRGPNAVGTDIAATFNLIDASLGTGTGNLGTLAFRSPTTKQTTGTTAHTLQTLWNIGHSQSIHPNTSGFVTSSNAITVTDEITAGSGTAALASSHSFLGKTFAARNTSVVTTNATTLYLTPPIAGTNMTLTNKYGLWNTGDTRFDGNILWDGQSAKTDSVARHTTSNTAGVSKTLTSGGATSGATDKAAGDLILAAGPSTGTGRGSGIRGQTNVTGLASSTSDNSLVDRFICPPTRSLADNTNTAIVNATLASNTTIAGSIDYAVHVFDGTNLQVEEGTVSWHGINKGGTFSGMAINKLKSFQDVSSGTLTVTWTITSANPAVITLNANSSLTPSTGYPVLVQCTHNKGRQAIAIQ